MCPEHSSHAPLTQVGTSTRTHAGLISEVMSTVYPESGGDGKRLVTSCSGDGEAVGMNVSAKGGRTKVWLPNTAFAVVRRLNGSVIVMGAVRLAMILSQSLQTFRVWLFTKKMLCIIGFQIGVAFQIVCR